MDKEIKPIFIAETERIYKSFENEISILRHTEPSKKTDIKLKEIVVSSYVKTYDYILYLCNLADYTHSFFQLPLLRSICEDLITISYILQETTPKQNYIIVKKRYEELNKSTSAQKDFFSKYNIGQIVPNVFNENTEISEIIKVHIDAGWEMEEANLPKVHRMAEKINLKYLYDFVYHGTSKAVHFDIFTLLSMGWGEIDENNQTIKPKFSYQNDYKHYFSFALFYSSYIFLRQTENYKDILELPDSIGKILYELEENYKKIDWPLLITFEQLNIKPPPETIRVINRIVKESKGI